MRFLIAVWGALIALSATCSAATLYNKNINGWFLGAYTDDTTGQFNHCAVSVGYQSGEYLVFAVDRNFNWSMGLANPSWQLTPGAAYRIAYQVDQQPPLSGDAVVNTPNLVEIKLIDSVPLFKAFQKGH
jgi:hypothetical protein